MKKRVSIVEIVNSNNKASRVLKKETMTLEEALILYKDFIKDVIELGKLDDLDECKKKCDFYEDQLRVYNHFDYHGFFDKKRRFEGDNFIYEYKTEHVDPNTLNTTLFSHKRIYKGFDRLLGLSECDISTGIFKEYFNSDYFEVYKDGIEGNKYKIPTEDIEIYQNAYNKTDKSGLLYFAVLYYQNAHKYKECKEKNTLRVGYDEKTKDLIKIYPIALENGDYLFFDVDLNAIKKNSNNWLKMSLYHFDEKGKISLIPYDKISLLDKSRLKTMIISSDGIPSFVKAGFTDDIEKLNSTLESYKEELSKFNNLELELYNCLDTQYPNKLNKKENEEQPECVKVISQKIKEIKQLINKDVNENHYLEDLKKIVDKYNRLVNEYEDNINSKLTFGVKNIDTIIYETNVELDALKDKVIRYNSSTKEYIEMLDYLERVLMVINRADVYKKDNFLCLLNDVFKVPLSYINDSREIKSRLLSELYTKPKSAIENYLKNIASNENVNKLPYNTVEELVYYLRQQLQPILYEISDLVYKKSICEEIKNDMKAVMDINYRKANNRAISLYMDYLNDVYRRCLIIVPESDTVTRNEISTIMSDDIDYTLSIEDILKQINDKYYKLIKVYNRVSLNDKREEIKELKKMYIELDAV